MPWLACRTKMLILHVTKGFFMNTFIEDMESKDVPFFNDKLQYINTSKVIAIKQSIEDVNLSKVIGTSHPSYHGKTWGQLKPVPGSSSGDIFDPEIAGQPLKRAVTLIHALEKNPEYYTDDSIKDEWSFYKLNDDYYIVEGNNRTVIARFFLHLNNIKPIIRNVKVTIVTCSEEIKKPSAIDRVINFFNKNNS